MVYPLVMRVRVVVGAAMVAGTLVSLVLAAVVWRGASNTDDSPRYVESLADWIGPDRTLDKLVARVDLIVVGRVTGISGLSTKYPPGYDPATDTHLPKGVTAGIEFTDFTVQVDEYLKGAGQQTLLLRLTGDLRTHDGSAQLPKPRFGQQMLLFLTRDSRDDAWHSRGPWGQMFEEGGKVRYAWRADDESHAARPVPYFQGLRLTEAIEVVRKLAQPTTP